MRHYIGLIHKQADSDFGVSFSDLPGVVTAGRTLDEARELAEEALSFHIEGLLADGEALRNLPILMWSRPMRGIGTVWQFLWRHQTEAPKAVRINVTLPEDVLAAIDRFARVHDFSRSGFIAQGAKRASGQ